MFALISLDVLDIKPETWLIYHDLTEGCQFSNSETFFMSGLAHILMPFPLSFFELTSQGHATSFRIYNMNSASKMTLNTIKNDRLLANPCFFHIFDLI